MKEERADEGRQEFQIYIEQTIDGIYITKQTVIPGLVLECSDLDELKEAIYEVAPHLLTSNLKIPRDQIEDIALRVFLSQEQSGASNRIESSWSMSCLKSPIVTD